MWNICLDTIAELFFIVEVDFVEQGPPNMFSQGPVHCSSNCWGTGPHPCYFHPSPAATTALPPPGLSLAGMLGRVAGRGEEASPGEARGHQRGRCSSAPGLQACPSHCGSEPEECLGLDGRLLPGTSSSGDGFGWGGRAGLAASSWVPNVSLALGFVVGFLLAAPQRLAAAWNPCCAMPRRPVPTCSTGPRRPHQCLQALHP